jgi:hypothetical protein
MTRDVTSHFGYVAQNRPLKRYHICNRTKHNCHKCHLPAAISNLTQSKRLLHLPQKMRGYACAQLPPSDVTSNESPC